MRVTWDENKRLANIRKHGIDFIGCEDTFAGFTLTTEDTSLAYGEQRFLSLGLLEGRVVSVCHTERGDVIRIISIRKATNYEQQQFFKELGNHLTD